MTLYDKAGNIIPKGTEQTTIGGQSGIFYMSFLIKASNSGNVNLNNVRVVSSTPQELTDAIQTPTSISLLSVGQSNILLTKTDNSCVSNLECGVSEKCVGLTPTCKIDVSNRIGSVIYSIDIAGDYQDAFGNAKTITTSVNLPITYEQDGVLLRFERKKTESLSLFANSWIAYDIDGDGLLEGLGGSSNINTGSVDCVGSGSSNFISYYGNYIIQKLGSRVYVCEDVGINDNTIYFEVSDNDGNDAVISLNPLEPYSTNNCPENPINTVCQEVYSLYINPPDQVCGDGLITSPEVCEINPLNLNGQTCSTVLGAGYSGTLDCQSDCLDFDSSQCSLGSGGNEGEVKLRTVRTDFENSEFAVAVDGNGNSCLLGDSLTKFGTEIGQVSFHDSSRNCDEQPFFAGGSVCTGLVDCTIISNVGFGDTPSGGDGVWSLYQDDEDIDEIWLCQDDSDGTGSSVIRLDTDDCPSDNDCATLSDSALSSTPTLEVSC